MPKFIDRTGETNIAKNGMQMTIIVYRGSNDIDVQFKDGSIRKGVTYNSFKVGGISSPNISPTSYNHTSLKQGRVGENAVAHNGMNMRIIAYRNANDIDVQFEDGSIATHKKYSMFKQGYIKNPNLPNNWNCTPNIDRIGESVITRNGNKMTIIAYRSANDIDVQFEDGAIASNKTYDSFKRCLIWHPTGVVGESHISKCGINMSIINRKSSANIDVKFETGFVVKHRNVSDFYLGKIGHPFPHQIGDITMESPAYIYKDEGNFYCKCNKCGIRDIMSIQEMKDHKCIAS